MISSVLLLIHDQSLRQLYHELLTAEHIEIMPVATVEHTVAMLGFNSIHSVILYPDDLERHTVDTFVSILRKMKSFAGTRLIFMTADPDQYTPLCRVQDVVLTIREKDPRAIVLSIVQSLK